MATNDLATIYYEPTNPGSYGGVKALHRHTKQRPLKEVAKWLSGEDTYTLHKPAIRKFPRRRTIVGVIDQQWQSDLVDLKNLAKHNDGYRYILTCIDVLSKCAWALPLKDKKGTTLTAAFRKIFEESARKPSVLQTDQGTEFKNATFQTFLKENKIKFFTTYNEEIKASIAERFNRTLKSRMFRYFTSKETRRYVDVLPKLMAAYNSAYHRSIKMAPTSVNSANQEIVWQNLYVTHRPCSTAKFSVGDKVRIAQYKRTFKKGYLPNWSLEIFTVAQIHPGCIPTYSLRDYNGEVLSGMFYAQELQKVVDSGIYKIEQILKTIGKGKTKKHFVKWLGYPTTFNSWIRDKDLTKQYK
jgi:transposase InsO family protein